MDKRFSAAATKPRGRGLPPLGPLPSWPTTPSSTAKAGLTVSSRSMSMSPKSSFFGQRMCHSAFCRPGIQPKRFFVAAERPVIIWVLHLGRSMMTSAASTGSSRVKRRFAPSALGALPLAVPV